MNQEVSDVTGNEFKEALHYIQKCGNFVPVLVGKRPTPNLDL